MKHDKDVLMIHEVDEDVLSKSLDQYILTFDDGLYSQYRFFNTIKLIPTTKIFFISTGIVADEEIEQTNSYITSSKAHDMFFNNNDASSFMKWSQIKHIMSTPGCFIGGHSHYHQYKPTLSEMIDDTRKMCNTLMRNNVQTNKFCFPYNKEHSFYKPLLINHGFTDFYSTERSDISDL